MLKEQMIIDYLSGKIDLKNFKNEFFSDVSLQDWLEEEKDIKPYTNAGSLFMFLVGPEASDLNVKDALKKFLSKRGIAFQYDDKRQRFTSLLYEVLPKWLEVEVEYFDQLYELFDGVNARDIKHMIRTLIKKDFKYINRPPNWLQGQLWPIESGRPLIFIGQLKMGGLLHDNSMVYVFYDDRTNEFKNIVQVM